MNGMAFVHLNTLGDSHSLITGVPTVLRSGISFFSIVMARAKDSINCL
jgi:hypothetical protein